MSPPANRPRTPSKPVVQPRTAPRPTPSAHSHSPTPPTDRAPRRSSSSNKIADPTKPKREVTLVACVDCRTSGRKCGSERPCERCIERGWQDKCRDARQVPGRPNFGRGPPESPPVARRRTISDAAPPTTPSTRRTSITSILAQPPTPSTTPPRRRTQSQSHPRPRRLSLSSDLPPLPPVPQRKSSLSGYTHALLQNSTLHYAPRPTPAAREQRSTEFPESFERYNRRELDAANILAGIGGGRAAYGGRASPVAPRRPSSYEVPTYPSTPTPNAYLSFPPYLPTPSTPSPSYRAVQFPPSRPAAPPQYSPERLHAPAYPPRSSIHPEVLATLSPRPPSYDSPRGRPLSYVSTGSGRSESPARSRTARAGTGPRSEYYPSWSASVVQAQASRGY